MITLNYDNKKSLDSQKKIYKGLRRILLTKPLSEITITDISKECNISRSTFYRNFDNISDILKVIFGFYYDHYLNTRAGEENQLLYFLDFWYYHKDLVYILNTQIPTILNSTLEEYSNKNWTPFQNKLKYELFVTIISKWSIFKETTPKEMENYLLDVLTKKSIDTLLDL